MKSLEGWKAVLQPILGTVFYTTPPYSAQSPYRLLYTVFGSEEILAHVQAVLPDGGRVSKDYGNNEDPYTHAVCVEIPSAFVRHLTPLETALKKLATFSADEKAALLHYWPGAKFE